MTLYPNIYRTLAPGPMVELRGYASACGLPGRLYACLDYGGPTGTARDGLAEGMLALAAQRQVLAPGQTLIEAGSGAFAAALTLAGRTSGHPVCLAMPDNTTAARQELLSGLGAQLLFSPAREGPAGARALAAGWAQKRDWYYTDWLACDDNPEYHRRVTGPAIVESIAREGSSLVDAVFIGVGSGGTITGVGECVKAWTNDVQMVAVEPYECQALGGGLLGPHGIPDIGYGLIPENYNPYVVDKIAAISSADAARAARTVLLTDAVPASVSGGAALAAAARFLAEGRSRSALCLIPGRASLL
ncbi:pyridoxal-phosphate dependent enzyme [Faecalibacterium sp. An192]|uniref:pyridoxal-phosphate dependent enzyme n=1 Tax=Faecalibacterium sp. An192 TaxID=1965581 RepID=UPI000B37E3E3|nr:pyridoxal-phosphate dependent enzyme [Faecalibacterium sp. An192]OUP28558.1 cysteine synthase A [Faecalibacterium sp. An192]